MQGRARDLEFGFSTFSKVEKILAIAMRCRAARVSSPANIARHAARVCCRRPEAGKKRPHAGRGEVESGWLGLGTGVDAGWSRDWAVAAVPRGGKVDYLSTRGNIRL